MGTFRKKEWSSMWQNYRTLYAIVEDKAKRKAGSKLCSDKHQTHNMFLMHIQWGSIKNFWGIAFPEIQERKCNMKGEWEKLNWRPRLWNSLKWKMMEWFTTIGVKSSDFVWSVRRNPLGWKFTETCYSCFM